MRGNWWMAAAMLALAGTAVAAEKHPGMTAVAAEVAAGDAAREAAALALLEAAEYQPAIIEAISKPAEAKPWFVYRPIFLTEARIDAGAKFFEEHRDLLAQVQAQSQVPAEYVVAIIGVETFYGRITGKWKVLDALTTLGLYYPPRAPYFRGELIRFLNLPSERGIELDLANVQGSYAGAMGLGQFMPTSFVKWAVDQNADGKIDLWTSIDDATASVANYLHDHGWVMGEPVTVPLTPGPGARRLRDTGLDPIYPLSQLVEWGYQPNPGSTIAPDQPSNLVALEVADGEYAYHAIFGNFRVITRYNRSPMYAMAVHELAQAIRARTGGIDP
ncbi:MAG: lytic murein transglycosylase B [Lysobacterales bacterium]